MFMCGIEIMQDGHKHHKTAIMEASNAEEAKDMMVEHFKKKAVVVENSVWCNGNIGKLVEI